MSLSAGRFESQYFTGWSLPAGHSQISHAASSSWSSLFAARRSSMFRRANSERKEPGCHLSTCPLPPFTSCAASCSRSEREVQQPMRVALWIGESRDSSQPLACRP